MDDNQKKEDPFTRKDKGGGVIGLCVVGIIIIVIGLYSQGWYDGDWESAFGEVHVDYGLTDMDVSAESKTGYLEGDTGDVEYSELNAPDTEDAGNTLVTMLWICLVLAFLTIILTALYMYGILHRFVPAIVSGIAVILLLIVLIYSGSTFTDAIEEEMGSGGDYSFGWVFYLMIICFIGSIIVPVVLFIRGDDEKRPAPTNFTSQQQPQQQYPQQQPQQQYPQQQPQQQYPQHNTFH